MIINPRVESLELLTLRYLSPRKTFSEKEQQYYIGLEKGFVGEKKFDGLCETFLSEWTFLTNLLLDSNHSFFQIDSLGLIQEGWLHLFDVKNFEGDIIVKGDNWLFPSGSELKNPLHQLNRCEVLLKRFLRERGIPMQIKPYLILINPNFTLYNAPVDPRIVFPTQLNSFLSKLQSIKPTFSTQKSHQLIDLLLTSNHPSYPNSLLPPYHYDELTKGIFCINCLTPMKNRYPEERGRVYCPGCQSVEENEEAMLRAIKEFKQLFPSRRITTSEVYNWCNGAIGMKTIQRILTKYFKKIGNGRFTYYTF